MSEPRITFEQLVAAEHEAGADSVSACDDAGPISECEWRARIVAPLLGIEVPPLPDGYLAIEAADGSVVESVR